MNYYYDVLVNFQDNDIYEFYEWEDTDNIEKIRKIPLFRINSEQFNEFMKYHLSLDVSFLDNIKCKTILENGKLTKNLEYAFLITDAKNVLAVELNNKGEVICLSKLQLEDDLNINEMVYNLKQHEIIYTKIKPRKVRTSLRQEEIIKNIISLELKTLFNAESALKIRYLYSEWFEENEDDYESAYKKMKDELLKPVDSNQYRIYELIKMSYKKSSLSN